MAKEVTVVFSEDPSKAPEVLISGEDWCGRDVEIAQVAIARGYRLRQKTLLNQEAKNVDRNSSGVSERGAGNPKNRDTSETRVELVNSDGDRTSETDQPAEREDIKA